MLFLSIKQAPILARGFGREKKTVIHVSVMVSYFSIVERIYRSCIPPKT